VNQNCGHSPTASCPHYPPPHLVRHRYGIDPIYAMSGLEATVGRSPVNGCCYFVSSSTATLAGPRDGARHRGARCYLRPASIDADATASVRPSAVGPITSQRHYRPHRALADRPGYWTITRLENYHARSQFNSPKDIGVAVTGQLADATGDFACLLWSPYVIGQTIIFSSCSFFLLSSIFFSSPNLSGRRLDVYHTSTHGVALVRI